MRLSDLMDAEVFDAGGRRAGRVHDVRLVQDGPAIEGFGPSFRVAGLVIGRSSLGERLGYGRGGVGGPWALRALFGLLHGDARYAPWEQVRSVGERRIELRASAGELQQVEALP